MLQSMTGYGRAQHEFDSKKITIEINSINNRYLDLLVRLPKTCSHFEQELKEIISDKIKRGKLLVVITIDEDPEKAVARLELNRDTANMYKKVFDTLKKEYNLPGEVDLQHFVNLPDLIKPAEEEIDEDELKSLLKGCLQEALDDLIQSRTDEGGRLLKDIEKHIALVEKAITETEKYAGEHVRNYHDKLKNKLKELLGDISVSDDMIAAEAALVAERSDITEECVRIRSHVSMLRQACESEEPVGKKMNFILQELYRESNTIGSKSLSSNISRNVIILKEEIEKIREQVQNLE